MQPDADARCIAAVLAGQREPFGELVERYQDAVVAVVRGYLRDASAAEDVAQEVFVNAFTALPQLREPRLFFPWLIQIARRRAAHASQRGEKRHEHLPLTGEEAARARDDGPDRLAWVMSHVEQLPEPYRQTVVLKYERNLSCKEIATMESVALGTVTSRLTRALVMLRHAMRRKEGKEA
ncbi:MAG: RNA polymerase sigma factor [Planctomycetota bacterium]|nr:RNA polymerase sigma factor [Planctomycetota bacterium]